MNVGIDVTKNIHEACILTESGEQIGNFIQIKNSKSSIKKFRGSVESAARELNLIPRIGMEATGIYWIPVCCELSRYYEIHLYNPSQIRGFAAVNIRGSKTDIIDAKTIAKMLRFGEAPKPSDMLEMGEEKLFELMKTTSRNYYSPDKTRELPNKAEDSISPEFIEVVLSFEFREHSHDVRLSADNHTLK